MTSGRAPAARDDRVARDRTGAASGTRDLPMQVSGFSLFETAIGPCAIAWGRNGLVATLLPERTADATRTKMADRHPELREAEAPTSVADAMRKVRALLDGERIDLSAILLDMAKTGAFERSVYALAQAIPPGETRTYGDLAFALGEPLLARAVGQALGRNPWPIIVPCHRITAARGRRGGFSAPGGVATKMRILEIEGAFDPGTLPLFSPQKI